MRLRSYLYVSAGNAERLKSASQRGADALIVDLEDGVALDQKAQARENLRGWLPKQEKGVSIWIRINPDALDEDLAVAVHSKVSGIVLPKSRSVEDIDLAELLLREYESKSNTSQLQVIALIETAEGVLNSLSIALHSRVVRLLLGEIDLRADLALSHKSGDDALQFARSSLLYASAAAKIDPPLASVSTNFKDLDRYRTSTVEYLKRGYFGRTCIHPNQVPIVNEVYGTSQSELDWAQDVITRMELAKGGATLDANGEMIDEAVAKIARRILGFS